MRTDALTGLANRRFFMETLDKEVSLARRHQVPLCLVMADLDHFKQINDTYGHDGGDQVLKAFASLLQQNTRKEDLPARFGGEEFIIILPHTAFSKALVMVERMRHEQESLLLPGLGVRVTASFGVSQLLPEDDPHSLIKRSDEALYRPRPVAATEWLWPPPPSRQRKLLDMGLTAIPGASKPRSGVGYGLGMGSAEESKIAL